MQIGFDLRFRTLAPVLIKAMTVAVYQFVASILGVTVLLCISACLPILRLLDAKKNRY